MQTIKCATGKDFDRMNDESAYSHLQDLVLYASGRVINLTAGQLDHAITNRTHFIMQVW